MSFDVAHYNQSTPAALAFYSRAAAALLEAEVDFLVGGGYAVHVHTRIARLTKDFDIFIRRSDLDRAWQCLERAGYRCELTYPHWLAKAFCNGDFIDIIFNSGNGCCPVDDLWFDHATAANVLGLTLLVCPPEETIWQKAYIMERERFDGADIAHLLRACADKLDWPRLMQRFDTHWRILLVHLVLFGLIYPGERSRIPQWVMDELIRRLKDESCDSVEFANVCFGTCLSRQQFLIDIEQWGYRDARLPPYGRMTPEDVALWTPAPDDSPGQP